MTNWAEIREEYVRGGITQAELAKKHGVSPASLRRRAAAEGWRAARSVREVGAADKSLVSDRLNRQLELTDRMLDVITDVIEKGSDAGNALDDERVLRVAGIMSDLFHQQRTILELLGAVDKTAGVGANEEGNK